MPVDESAESSGIPTVTDTAATESVPTPAPQAPAESALPTFEIVTSDATIDPPSTPTPAPQSTSLPVDDDQPAPYESIQTPASESFNPSRVPAFTESTDIPLASVAPVYSSTPCSTEVKPTEAPEYPSENVPSQAPTSEEGGAVSTGTTLGAELPTGTALPTDLPPYPIGTGFPSFPPSPTGTGGPGFYPIDRPGFGWGRPRPSGFWPRPNYPRPTGGFGRGRGHGPRPSAGFEPERYDFGMGQGKPSSTPCTLQTKVRPTETAQPFVR